MPVGGILAASALTVIGAACVARHFARERPRPPLVSYDLTAWGDVIELHPEARRTTAQMGQRGEAGAEQEQPSVETNHIAHGRGQF